MSEHGIRLGADTVRQLLIAWLGADPESTDRTLVAVCLGDDPDHIKIYDGEDLIGIIEYLDGRSLDALLAAVTNGSGESPDEQHLTPIEQAALMEAELKNEGRGVAVTFGYLPSGAYDKALRLLGIMPFVPADPH